MNKVNLVGRVGSDPELRYTPNGKAVAELNLAVDDGFGDNKKTVWMSVTIWDKTAECAGKYVKKGDKLGISGRLSQDEWTDKETGKKVRKTKITCEDMHLLEPKRDSAPSQDPHPRRPLACLPPAPPPADTAEEDDDIPF